MTESTNHKKSLRVVIVGGGISGLSAAWYLQQQAAAQQLNLDTVVLEKSDRWGGKILSEAVDGYADTPFIVEGGPDSFLTQKPWALALSRELGLEERLLGTNDTRRSVYVLNKGRPVVLPDGVQLIVPTRFMPFVRSPLISPLGKLRMGFDLFIPARRDDGDELMADFVRRRLGSEALDKIAEPLLAGIHNSDSERQSIMATFPRFRTIEKEHGSLVRGMLALKRQRAAQSAQPSQQKISAFVSFNNGTYELVEALRRCLRGGLRSGVSVSALRQVDGHYEVQLDDGAPLEADAVILCTPAYVSADLVRELAPQAAAQLEAIRYASTGTLSLGFRQADLPRLLDGFGLLIPGSEQRPINAITMSSTKFDRRAPEGHVLLRVFFGGSRSPESMQLDDETLLHKVREELRDLLGVEARPLFHRIYRWWKANPQYDVGHLARVEAIESALPAGVYLTGSPYRGVGIPDCVHQSQETAAAVLADWTAH